MAKSHYKRAVKYPLFCCFCGEKIKNRDHSVDHIIPRSVCYAIERPMLIFDIRNFRSSHKQCNRERADETSDLPEAVLEKIKQLGYSS